MTSSSPEKTNRIRDLNDQLRRNGVGGRVVVTSGIHALGTAAVCRVCAAVAQFDKFSEENDPWGEHDCALVAVNSWKVLFKIDLYEEPEVKAADGHPVTTRVLTIMLAEEW